MSFDERPKAVALFGVRAALVHDMGSRKSKATWLNVVVALGAMLLALAVAEGLARLLGVQPRFGQLIFVRGVATRTVDGVPLWSDMNPRADGDDIRRAAADAAAFKIVGLGDSIMYGVGQSEEATYLEQTRRELAQRSKRRVEILNLAVPGYNTKQENLSYKELDPSVRPDLVLVNYWVDDAHQYRLVGGYVVDVGNISEENGRLVVRALPLPAVIGDFLLVHSRLYDLLTQFIVNLRRQKGPDTWESVPAALAEIQQRAQATGGRLVVLASPALDRAVPIPNTDLGRLRQFAAGHGIEVIDVSEWLQGYSSKDVGMDMCHLSAEGHRIVGKHLADYLLQHDLRDETAPSR